MGLAEKYHERFGETALRQGLIQQEQLEELLAVQRSSTPSLDECIVGLGLMEPQDLAIERSHYQEEQTKTTVSPNGE